MTLTSAQYRPGTASGGGATSNVTTVSSPGATVKPWVQGVIVDHVSSGLMTWASAPELARRRFRRVACSDAPLPGRDRDLVERHVHLELAAQLRPLP
jgi:hypothetical protein